MNILKASEVLKIAVQIEKNGMAFYTQIKEQTKYFPLQQVFDYLAKEEVKHQRTFELLLGQVGDYEPAESYPGEYERYLKAIAGENIFAQSDAMKQIAKKAVSDKEAIDMGIGFEKDSIIFYSEINKFVPASDEAVVEKVIAEEKEHWLKLLELKKKSLDFFKDF